MNFGSILNLVFPAHCIGCRKPTSGAVVCGECLAAVPVNQTLFCGKCRLRLAAGKKVCHKDHPYVLGAAAGYSNELIKEMIRLLKFKFVKSAADSLGELLAKYAGVLGLEFENFLVVPLPLSAKRLRERGFNQSELIARRFAALTGLAVAPDALSRIRDSKPQSESKGADERRENVRGAFAAKNPSLVAGKNILLLDDVVTSGATMLEAAKTLKAAGAKTVVALAAAMA